MTASSPPKPGDSAPSEVPDRDRRLADALRENLRRRKAQARAKQGAAKTSENTENPPERSPSE